MRSPIEIIRDLQSRKVVAIHIVQVTEDDIAEIQREAFECGRVAGLEALSFKPPKTQAECDHEFIKADWCPPNVLQCWKCYLIKDANASTEPTDTTKD